MPAFATACRAFPQRTHTHPPHSPSPPLLHQLLSSYYAGEVDRIELMYTSFISMINSVEIKEWDKLLKKIELGEARIQRRLDMGSAFHKKCARYKHPFLALRLDYGNGGTKGAQFSEEEDRFLVCMASHLGYGAWDELAREVRKAWAFRFDWWLRTRTPQELGRLQPYNPDPNPDLTPHPNPNP